MTQPAPPSRPVASTRSILARALLAVAMLVPVSMLFAQVWQSDSQKVAFTTQERRGITYLRALEPVTTALTRAQSIAVGGDTVSFDALDRAVLAAGAVDDELGGALRTHDRWAGLRTKIQQLHTRSIIGPDAAYSAYSEVTGLVLALAQKVRDESGLVRDPDADTYYLEDAAALQLPEGVVAAGQYSDRIIVALSRPTSRQDAATADIVGARAQLLSNATALGDDVRLAVDATASQTLSGDLLAKLDRFRLSIDALVPASALSGGRASIGDSSQASMDKAEVQAAATELSAAMLSATDHLLVRRSGALGGDRDLALLTLIVAILIALAPLALAVTRRLRGTAAGRSPAGRSAADGAAPRGGTGRGAARRDDPKRDPLSRAPIGRDPLGRDPLSRAPIGRDPLSRDMVGRDVVSRDAADRRAVEPAEPPDSRTPALLGVRTRAERPSAGQWERPGAAR